MRGLRFSIFLWLVTVIAVLCLKLPTVEVEEPSPVVEVVEVVTPEPEPEVTPQPWTDEEVIVLAKMLWGEKPEGSALTLRKLLVCGVRSIVSIMATAIL